MTTTNRDQQGAGRQARGGRLGRVGQAGCCGPASWIGARSDACSAEGAGIEPIEALTSIPMKDVWPCSVPKRGAPSKKRKAGQAREGLTGTQLQQRTPNRLRAPRLARRLGFGVRRTTHVSARNPFVLVFHVVTDRSCGFSAFKSAWPMAVEPARFPVSRLRSWTTALWRFFCQGPGPGPPKRWP